MSKQVKIAYVNVPETGRLIVIGDIHGEGELFERLLEKVAFCEMDTLIILGDLYLKGRAPQKTLAYCMALSECENVHVLRGNCDWGGDDFITARELAWLEDLPHIIETELYTFVHSGLTSADLESQDPQVCIRYQNFMNVSVGFDKWVIVGHWPVSNYHLDIPNHNPFINREKKIISIDGGMVIAPDGQLNALIIENGEFSYDYVDEFPVTRFDFDQVQFGGTINVSFVDNKFQMLERRDDLCTILHLSSGKTLTVPTSAFYTNGENELCISDMATDYHMPYTAGEEVQIVAEFDDRLFVKKHGICGWLLKEGAQ